MWPGVWTFGGNLRSQGKKERVREEERGKTGSAEESETERLQKQKQQHEEEEEEKERLKSELFAVTNNREKIEKPPPLPLCTILSSPPPHAGAAGSVYRGRGLLWLLPFLFRLCSIMKELSRADWGYWPAPRTFFTPLSLLCLNDPAVNFLFESELK